MTDHIQSDINKKLHAVIKQEMKKKGHTNASLGEMLGINPHRVSHMLNHSKGITSLMRIAEVLGLEIDITVKESVISK